MAKSVNRIIKVLVMDDFFFNSGWGLLAPIFAIFIVQNIQVLGTEEAAKVAGFASLFFWLTKSLLQIPIGRYLDKNHGEKDDFWFMILGTSLTALVPLGYMISYLPWHIYILQVVHGIGSAMLVPSWLAIFTRHIDKGKEAFEWSLETTVLGVGVGVAGGIGGIMVAFFGFQIVFVLASLLTFMSALFFTFIYKDISSKDKETLRAFPLERPYT